MVDCGYGPWYVALLFNLKSKGSNKKQTELRVHSMAYMFATLRNVSCRSELWCTMMVVGPFMKYKHALAFFQLWSRQTRGKARRMKRAVTLVQRFHKQYNLQLWVQSTECQQLVQQLQAKQRVYAQTEGALQAKDEQSDAPVLTVSKLKASMRV